MTLEASILSASRRVNISVTYSTLSAFDSVAVDAGSPLLTSISSSLRNTPCWKGYKNDSGDPFAATWVFSFGLSILGIMTFSLVTEERGRGLLGLFGSLRRIGLLDFAYWTSWLAAFQAIVLTGSALACIVAAGLGSVSVVLSNLDLGVLFLILWLGGS